MPKKPTKWGIKVWVCADVRTSYVTKFSIYTGKENDENAGKKLDYRIVMKLLKPYLGKHYKVYFDNFHTSPELCADLLKRRHILQGLFMLVSSQYDNLTFYQHFHHFPYQCKY